MSRPANADGKRTRQRILSSATYLFAEHGPDGASVRDVAKRARVSVGMVNHYFLTKAGLYDDCVGEIFEELEEMKELLERDLAGEAPLDELFARAVRTTFRFACEHRTAVRLLIRQAASTGALSSTGEWMLTETIDMVSEALSQRLGRNARELRLPLQSIVFLVARYAAQNPYGLSAIADVSGPAATAAVEDHLVQAARGLLGLDAPKKQKGNSK